MVIRRTFLATAALLSSGLVSAAWAQAAPQRAVVELFTSQGCSSCPPADALFVKLAQEPGLIVLSFPVEIWDYLGWKDTLAQSSFTHRQKFYGLARGDRQVYTPQAIINGTAHAVGSDFHAIDAARRSTGETGALALSVSLEQSGNGWKVKAANGPGKGVVWLVLYERSKNVQIGRGENSGRSITYANVAKRLIRLADYSGEALTLDLPAEAQTSREEGFAVLVQSGSDKRPGAILGAIDAPHR